MPSIPTSHHKYPPFPSTLPTAPLVSISLSSLEAHDPSESQSFFTACRSLGFFYLELSGSRTGEALIAEAEQIHDIQQQFFARTVAEKEEFANSKLDGGSIFGYRHNEVKGVKGEDGSAARNESYNMRKDDFMDNCAPLPTHDLIKQHWDLLTSFVRHCRAACELMMAHLDVHLGIPVGTLVSLHRISERSGDHIRFNQTAAQPFDESVVRLGEHTDFGSITILFNWLGGLQIRLPEESPTSPPGDWVYVKPVPGSAVVNLGDALVKFTAGILRANIHRVVPPPGPQGEVKRNSLVYFSRPEDAVILRRLKGGLIDAQPQSELDKLELTSDEWITRRSLGDLRGILTHKGIESRVPEVVGAV